MMSLPVDWTHPGGSYGLQWIMNKDKTHSWRYQHTTTITLFRHKGETDLKKVSLGVYFIVLASFLEDNRYLNTTGENMHRLD